MNTTYNSSPFVNVEAGGVCSFGDDSMDRAVCVAQCKVAPYLVLPHRPIPSPFHPNPPRPMPSHPSPLRPAPSRSVPLRPSPYNPIRPHPIPPSRMSSPRWPRLLASRASRKSSAPTPRSRLPCSTASKLKYVPSPSPSHLHTPPYAHTPIPHPVLLQN